MGFDALLKDLVARDTARIEAHLHASICAKLYERGRILPGEAIYEEPRELGGKVVWEFPDYAKASSR